MSRDNKNGQSGRSRIRMINCTASGNGGDGIHIEGNHDIELTGVRTSNNGGKGINVVSQSDEPPTDGSGSKIRKFITDVTAAVTAGVITESLKK